MFNSKWVWKGESICFEMNQPRVQISTIEVLKLYSYKMHSVQKRASAEGECPTFASLSKCEMKKSDTWQIQTKTPTSPWPRWPNRVPLRSFAPYKLCNLETVVQRRWGCPVWYLAVCQLCGDWGWLFGSWPTWSGFQAGMSSPVIFCQTFLLFLSKPKQL